jgi:hypothetical protein
MYRLPNANRSLRCELLESRCVLSTLVAETPTTAVDNGDFRAVIVAGDPNGSPPDSPANRVDANVATSPFAGVGSLRINTRHGAYICTAAPFDATHVLTAAHCLDINNDGRSDKKDGITSVYFQLNLDTDTPGDQIDASIRASSWRLHPDFTGFNRPSVNDDVAVVTLGLALPAGVPTYALASTDMSAGETSLVMVGYGQSGDGVNGYYVSASWTTKRVGENVVDAFYGQDDSGRAAANEVFRYDFDGPSGNGAFGGPTLGNDRETTLGGGDSGGPSFVLAAGADPNLASSYQIAGVNTFTQGFNAPRFGSLGGGINVFAYRDWVLTAAASGGGGSTGGGAGGRPSGSDADSGLGFAVASWVMTPQWFDEPRYSGTVGVTSADDDSQSAPLAVNDSSWDVPVEFLPTQMSSRTPLETPFAGTDCPARDADTWFAELGAQVELPLLAER